MTNSRIINARSAAQEAYYRAQHTERETRRIDRTNPDARLSRNLLALWDALLSTVAQGMTRPTYTPPAPDIVHSRRAEPVATYRETSLANCAAVTPPVFPTPDTITPDALHREALAEIHRRIGGAPAGGTLYTTERMRTAPLHPADTFNGPTRVEPAQVKRVPAFLPLSVSPVRVLTRIEPIGFGQYGPMPIETIRVGRTGAEHYIKNRQHNRKLANRESRAYAGEGFVIVQTPEECQRVPNVRGMIPGERGAVQPPAVHYVGADKRPIAKHATTETLRELAFRNGLRSHSATFKTEDGQTVVGMCDIGEDFAQQVLAEQLTPLHIKARSGRNGNVKMKPARMTAVSRAKRIIINAFRGTGIGRGLRVQNKSIRVMRDKSTGERVLSHNASIVATTFGNHRAMAGSVRVDDTGRIPEFFQSPETGAIDLREDTAQAIASLPEAQQKIARMMMEGFSARDIADALYSGDKKTVKALDSWAHRNIKPVREALRALLASYID
jgi:hypothetical protein